jgi:hypothetical protein
MSSPKKVTFADLTQPKPWQNYRAKVVAQYTGLSERLILRDCADGKIKHSRIGRAVTIPGSEILRLNGQDAV